MTDGLQAKSAPAFLHSAAIVLPEDIRVGERFRKDLGNLDGLAASIEEIGLLHPIVISEDFQLIAGARRLAAWQRTSHAGTPIRCSVLNLDAIVRGEAAENLQRKDFTPSEAVAIARALRPLEEAAARERQGTRTDLHGSHITKLEHGGNFPPSETGKVRDIVAKKVGLSSKTLERAEALVAAAEAEPERFGKLLADMDRTGRVNGPHKRLVNIRRGAAIRAEPPPFPGNGPYRVGVSDVPWPFDERMEDPSHRGVPPYPTMTLDEIRALGPKVRDLMHVDAVLWFWTTNFYLISGDALRIVQEWGFEPKGLLTWGKPSIGLGDWLRNQTEHCILAVRGSPTLTLTNHSTLLLAQAPRIHSAKPDEFYRLVEELCPAPRYAELFQRTAQRIVRPNWDGHGDEAGEVLEIQTADCVPGEEPDSGCGELPVGNGHADDATLDAMAVRLADQGNPTDDDYLGEEAIGLEVDGWSDEEVLRLYSRTHALLEERRVGGTMTKTQRRLQGRIGNVLFNNGVDF